MKKKICVITGSRAEYGLLRPLLAKIKDDEALELRLIVTGMHLSAAFGLTYREIENDGFAIDKKIGILSDRDAPSDISRAMATVLAGCADAYNRLRPRLVIVIGDRFEIFAAATAAHVARIPIAHMYGGEVTEGSLDDAFRHSITKMSYLHFTSTEKYRQRVIQLGEDPERVFKVGALGIDNINGMNLLSKGELEREIKFEFNKHNLLVTSHPATLEDNTAKQQFKNLLGALDGLEDTNIIFTKANADTGGRMINDMINMYVSKNRCRCAAFASLGQLNYLSTMRFVDAVVGNSSSGIVEAPSFKIGTINIGDRQSGRIKADSIIDCRPLKADIIKAIEKVYSKAFQASLRSVVNPYGDGNAAKRIIAIIKKADILTVKKRFFDIQFAANVAARSG